MAMLLDERRPSRIYYPDSDGLPMSDNTTHGDAIEYIHGVVGSVVADDDNAFAAADHLWYYREGHPEIRVGPDVYVVWGRPKRHRGSYQQWNEDGIAPQVVFEVVSPQNRKTTASKVFLYDELGVEEYYIYDPGYNGKADLATERRTLRGFVRNTLTGRAEVHESFVGWTSPRLGITFGWDDDDLLALRDETMVYPRYNDAIKQAATLRASVAEADAQAEAARAQVQAANAQTEAARAEAAAATARAVRLSAALEALRASGVDIELD